MVSPSRRNPVGGGPSREFQVAHAGGTEYRVVGGGESVWADGISDASRLALEAKWMGNPGRSPFVQSSGIPDDIRGMIVAGQVAEFSRYRAVIADPGNPLLGLHVTTNSQDAWVFFRGLMTQLDIPGVVTVVGG